MKELTKFEEIILVTIFKIKEHAYGVRIRQHICENLDREITYGNLYSALDQRPAFLLNVPSTWETPQARHLYAHELKRLGRFLTRLGGTSPAPATLRQTMLSYDDQRARHRAAPAEPTAREQVRLALVGGPRLPSDSSLLEMLRAGGARMVLDATESGVLGCCRAFEQEALADPFAELVDAYFDSIHHVGRRPNTGFYQCLQDALQTHDIQGVIWRRYLWCDLWHAELARFREACDLPVLELEVSDPKLQDQARMLNRLQAFVEMLK